MAYFFQSPAYWKQITENISGSAQPNCNATKLSSLTIPVPPLNEQRRIVAKLEKLLSRVDAAQTRLATIPRILKRFRQSVLAPACSGQLTAGWRIRHPNSEPAASRLEKLKQARLALVRNGAQAAKISEMFSEIRSVVDPEVPSGWLTLRAESICDFITKGTTPDTKKITSKGDVPFLKVQHIIDNKLEFSSLPCYVPDETHNGVLKRSKVFPRDVLMNIVGPPLNKVAIVPNDFPEWNINQALAIFRPVGGIEPEYLQLNLSYEGTLEHVLRETRGVVGQSNISLEQCRHLMILVPSLSEQQEIIRRVEALFKTADALEARYRKAKAHVDKLTQSILAKAFRGELVPQDPNDEPATLMLELIKKKKGGKAVRPKRRHAAG
jgi:type I restriction enzyme S subunit